MLLTNQEHYSLNGQIIFSMPVFSFFNLLEKDGIQLGRFGKILFIRIVDNLASTCRSYWSKPASLLARRRFALDAFWEVCRSLEPELICAAVQWPMWTYQALPPASCLTWWPARLAVTPVSGSSCIISRVTSGRNPTVLQCRVHFAHQPLKAQLFCPEIISIYPNQDGRISRAVDSEGTIIISQLRYRTG